TDRQAHADDEDEGTEDGEKRRRDQRAPDRGKATGGGGHDRRDEGGDEHARRPRQQGEDHRRQQDRDDRAPVDPTERPLAPRGQAVNQDGDPDHDQKRRQDDREVARPHVERAADVETDERIDTVGQPDADIDQPEQY